MHAIPQEFVQKHPAYLQWAKSYAWTLWGVAKGWAETRKKEYPLKPSFSWILCSGKFCIIHEVLANMWGWLTHDDDRHRSLTNAYYISGIFASSRWSSREIVSESYEGDVLGIVLSFAGRKREQRGCFSLAWNGSAPFEINCYFYQEYPTLIRPSIFLAC